MKHHEETLRRSQYLRKNMTKQERHLWYDFLKMYPVQFHRQVPVGCYYADFLCHKAKLILELDGSQHYEGQQLAYDHKRTAYLEEEGYYVARFSNMDVERNFTGVCEAIDLLVKQNLNK